MNGKDPSKQVALDLVRSAGVWFSRQEENEEATRCEHYGGRSSNRVALDVAGEETVSPGEVGMVEVGYPGKVDNRDGSKKGDEDYCEWTGGGVDVPAASFMTVNAWSGAGSVSNSWLLSIASSRIRSRCSFLLPVLAEFRCNPLPLCLDLG
nr:hypothetical protein [Tanacetum cinerariifolium]